MADSAQIQQNVLKILCCVCGIPIVPNSVNTCPSCLASNSNITKGISTEVTLHQCRDCKRWHKEAGKWIGCELESRELMSLCLSHISGIKSMKSERNTRLVDASWVWTEPHSMRLKVRLTLQKEVHTGTILQQSFMVTFIVRNQQCTDCQAEYRQGAWKALVQVRQRVGHKRTFLYLEQLILKHGAHRGCLNIEAFRDGMDFYFPDKNKAVRFQCFLENVVPIKTKVSKKLISTDDKSNISNFKYTNLVEICPLCKDDLVFLPMKTARALGNISQLVLVKNISNIIHFVDPLSGQTASMTPEAFWRDPIRPIIKGARSRMVRFVVLGKEPVELRKNVSKRTMSKKQKTRLARLTVAKEDDLGANDIQYEELSHLGYLMKAGDVCAGYDLRQAQFEDDEADNKKLPDIVIIRKLYGGAADDTFNLEKKRIWSLKRLDVVKEELAHRGRGAKNESEMDDIDEEDFMQEVEADREMRQTINLYKKPAVAGSQDGAIEQHDNDDDDDDDQQIKLDELLDGLALDDGPDMDEEDPGDFVDEVLEGERAAKDGISYMGREDSRLAKEREAAFPVTSNSFAKEFDLDDL